MLLAIPFGLAIGIAVGLLGGGGSVLAVPVLVYVLGQNVAEATTTSLVVVAAGSLAGGLRLRALIVVLWRAGLPINEALALAESDLDRGRGAVLVSWTGYVVPAESSRKGSKVWRVDHWRTARGEVSARERLMGRSGRCRMGWRRVGES